MRHLVSPLKYQNDEFGLLIALCILVVIFILPVFSKALRQNMEILIVFWVLVGLHQITAFLNAYIFKHTLIGAHYDAYTFHLVAQRTAINEEWVFKIGGFFYTEFLGLIYRWFGLSHFLGEQLSILAFAFSCIVFIKIQDQLGMVRYRIYSLLAFGALPTMIIVGSITLRESYQLLFFMLSVHLGIAMQLKGRLNAYFFLFVLSALTMGCFHNVLIIYSILMIVLFFVWNFRPYTYSWRIKKLHLLAVLVIPVLLACVMVFSETSVPGNSRISSLIGLGSTPGHADDLWDLTVGFRGSSMLQEGRASYGVILDNSSLFTTIYSSLKMYMYYLFAPFPWQVMNIVDIYAACESFMRMTLIWFSLKHWHNAYGVNKRTISLLFILYFSMTIMWATGTTNYGTAIRHHMLTWWILALLGIPFLIEKIHCIWSAWLPGRRSKSLNLAGKV